MDALFDKIARAVAENRVVFSVHADNQLTSRDLVRWQIVSGFAEGEHVASLPQARPNPKIIMKQMLPDGSDVFVVWSYLQSIDRAKVVTALFGDRR